MLSGSMKLVGSWLDLNGLYEARQRGEPTATRRFVEKHTLTLSKLPCWEHLDDDEYKRYIQGLVDSIAEETAAMHASARSEPLGVKELKKLRPNQRTAHPDRSPKPSCTPQVVTDAGSSARSGGVRRALPRRVGAPEERIPRHHLPAGVVPTAPAIRAATRRAFRIGEAAPSTLRRRHEPSSGDRAWRSPVSLA